MKPFNLEESKAGKKVITKDGREVKILCWDRKEQKYPIVALVGKDKEVYEFTKEGRFFPDEESNLDLFMDSEKIKGWCNIYKDNEIRYIQGLYSSKEEAIEKSKGSSHECVATIKVEWDEASKLVFN